MRLLVVAYGAAAVLGAAAAAAGASVAATVALFWLGGAAVTLTLAATPGLNGWFRTRRAPPAHTADLDAWRADAAADAQDAAVQRATAQRG